jgi:nitrogen regulatory protein P-II 1
MKEVKAFVHRHRVAEVVHALNTAGYRHLTVIDVRGLLRALSAREEEYSIELGERVTHEVRLELVCEDAAVERAIQLIGLHARTGQAIAGWVYVSPVERAIPINGKATTEEYGS